MKDIFKKIISKKTLLIAIPVLLAAAAATAVILVMNANRSFRVIKLQDYEGKVEVRRKAANVELFSGLQLVNGDVSTTGDESLMTLLIDSDKYMSVTQNTEFEVKATGTDQKGKVRIDLKKGKAFFEIENKLNGPSVFEVNTPNAVTSVRGTKFVTAYDPDENSTHWYVEEGTVKVTYGKKQTLEINAFEAVTIKDDAVVERSTSENKLYMFIFYHNSKDYLNDYGVSFDVGQRQLIQLDCDLKDKAIISRLNKVTERNQRMIKDRYDTTGFNDGDDLTGYVDLDLMKNVTSYLPSTFKADLGDGIRTYRVENATFDNDMSHWFPETNDPIESDSADAAFPNMLIGPLYSLANVPGSKLRYTYYFISGFTLRVSYSLVSSSEGSASETTQSASAAETDMEAVPIDAAHFPDEVLRKYLKDHYDEDGDGILNGHERNNVLEIIMLGDPELPQNVDEIPPDANMFYRGLKSLDGIGYFPKLHRIDLTYQNITDLDLSRNSEIDSLVIIGCKIRSLDISGTKIIDRVNRETERASRSAMTPSPNIKTEYIVIGYEKNVKSNSGEFIFCYDEGTEIITGGEILQPEIVDRT